MRGKEDPPPSKILTDLHIFCIHLAQNIFMQFSENSQTGAHPSASVCRARGVDNNNLHTVTLYVPVSKPLNRYFHLSCFSLPSSYLDLADAKGTRLKKTKKTKKQLTTKVGTRQIK